MANRTTVYISNETRDFFDHHFCCPAELVNEVGRRLGWDAETRKRVHHELDDIGYSISKGLDVCLKSQKQR